MLDAILPSLDLYELTRKLDQAKSKIFMGKNAAFMGSLMSSLDYIWDEGISTACTDCATYVAWNPQWFVQLEPETRLTILAHELWHPALLHNIRMGERDPELWNFATDIKINNMLFADGYSFKEIGWCWRDPSYPLDALEEEIYEDLIRLGKLPPGGAFGQLPTVNPNNALVPGITQNGDMTPTTKQAQMQSVMIVMQAVEQAKMIGGGAADTIPNGIESIIKQFLAPVVPWESVLGDFFTELVVCGHSWRRPSRRSSEIYLPSPDIDEGGLMKVNDYMDVSGSCTNHDIMRFNSEMKYLKDRFNPKSFNLIQFDEEITSETEIKEADEFEEVKIVGRRGTDLRCVCDHIHKTRPTGVIIFSDLECAPMERLDYEVPVLWVVIRNRDAVIPFGKSTHIRR